MQYYFENKKDILTQLETDEAGLSQEKAQERIVKCGKNKLAEVPKVSTWRRFLEQLSEPMILVLIAAAIVSGITAQLSGGHGFTDVFIIMAVVITNAVLGVYQESKAEKAIEALKNMTAATSKVLRDGQIVSIKSEDLTIGDIIVLEAGDAIPADARIIECASLQVEEAALTGESVPVIKTDKPIDKTDTDTPLGDRKNMVYMGSIAVYGRCRAVVVAIGMDTEMGKIASALADAKDEKTPLQRKLSQLSKMLTFIVIGICIFIFAFRLITLRDFSTATTLDTFMIAVSLAVAAIPEGLATVVTIVLAIGVTNMSKHNAVIRKLTAVETLGCAQIICSDKTGTLTQNKMTVTESKTADESLLAKTFALASDAELSGSEAIGEPTECALVNFANKLGINKNKLSKDYPRSGEAPFDSTRKMMSVVCKEQGEFINYTKGAPDAVIACCTHWWDGTAAQKMTEQKLSEIASYNKQMADNALRVLAGAFKKFSSEPRSYEPDALEQQLIFVGLVGMIDPVRPEVIDAVKKCRSAGIRPIMITGDHIDTAVAIAKQIGIIDNASEAITGMQLDKIDDETFAKTITNYGVYARVKPENKTRIVNTWKQQGYICAMTGDGVNDAPSIKSADIGIGMGITGTDVTKNVADMVLADDNFATIVGAVAEGRRIYDNIRKSVQFLLASNLSEVISIFVATLLGFTILKPVHLLFINLITDTFPALALGMEEAEDDVMNRPPRDPKESIFADGVAVNIVFQGVMVSVLTIAAYFIGHYIESGAWEIAESEDGITMAFLTMSMAEIFHSFNMRSLKNSVFSLKTKNVYLWVAMLASLLCTLAVIYIPVVANAFGFTTISFNEYLVSMALAFLVIPIVEITKRLQK